VNRDEIRNLCREMIDAHRESSSDFPGQAGKGLVLAGIALELLDEVDRLTRSRDSLAETLGRVRERLGEMEGECSAAVASRDEAIASRDALIDFRIGPWRGGGYAACLPWRSDCYPGGTWLNTGTCHFETRDEAVAAVRSAAGLDKSTEGEGEAKPTEFRPGTDLWNCFHRAWTRAVGQPAYDKSAWLAAEVALASAAGLDGEG
jgi:hypothetical protein